MAGPSSSLAVAAGRASSGPVAIALFRRCGASGGFVASRLRWRCADFGRCGALARGGVGRSRVARPVPAGLVVARSAVGGEEGHPEMPVFVALIGASRPRAAFAKRTFHSARSDCSTRLATMGDFSALLDRLMRTGESPLGAPVWRDGQRSGAERGSELRMPIPLASPCWPR